MVFLSNDKFSNLWPYFLPVDHEMPICRLVVQGAHLNPRYPQRHGVKVRREESRAPIINDQFFYKFHYKVEFLVEIVQKLLHCTWGRLCSSIFGCISGTDSSPLPRWPTEGLSTRRKSSSPNI